MRRSSSGPALLFVASLALAARAGATEYGLGNYQLGLVLPLAGCVPPPGVYFWDTYYLYQGNSNLYQNSATRNPSNVTYNLAANIGILAWFTDATLFGGELGFANTSAYGSETTTVATPYVDALGAERHVTTQQTAAAFADTEFSAILGWQAGDRHWSLTVSGFVPTGELRRGADRADRPQSPVARRQGRLHLSQPPVRPRTLRSAGRQRQRHQRGDELSERRRASH